RMLQNGKDTYFTLPIKNDSDFLDVDQRYLVDDFQKEADKLLRRIEGNYLKAPYFEEFFPVVEKTIDDKERNLFDYILHSVQLMKQYLQIQTPIRIFSKLGKEIHQLKAQDKVIGACKALHATHYINSSGGIHLYNKADFKNENIELLFYQPKKLEYPQ